MDTKAELIFVYFKINLMKILKSILILIFTVVIVSCQSNYRGRMVRVKKHKQVTNRVLVDRGVVQPQKTNLKLELEGKKNVNHVYSNFKDLEIVSKELKKVKKIRNQYPIIPRVIIDQPQDSIRRFSDEEIYIRDQYRKANTNAWISLILLLTSFITGIGIFFAIPQSIKAIRIYREYRNPGVPEYYGLAWGVLIASIFLILFLIVLIVGIFSGGII